MTRQQFLLSLLLGVMVVGAITYAVPQYSKQLEVGSSDSKRKVPQQHLAASKQNVSESFVKEFEQVREAEKISDPVLRCLAYPNLLEFHWDQKVVEAFCRLSLRKMISWEEIKDALDQHHPEIVDKGFGSYLEKTYQPGEHGFLIWSYDKMFQSSSKEVSNVVQRWVELDPKSAYALVARGTHYVASAGDARGGQFASSTPAENFTRMHEFAAKAKVDLKEALRREPRLIVAYHALITVARQTSDRELLSWAVEKALALDPADHWIYENWMSGVEPRWGGSEAEMQNVADRATLHENENPLLKRTEARPLCVEAEMTNCSECGPGRERERVALELYRKAAMFGPVGCFLDFAGDSAERMGGDDESVVRYNSQAYRFLGEDKRLFRRALALQRLGRFDWAQESMNMVKEQRP
jgi:Domain of unknown function (DUF4034)